jgi:hypothetical protein
VIKFISLLSTGFAMFSGIIAAVGRITEITPREVGCRLHVDAGKLIFPRLRWVTPSPTTASA